MGHKEVLRVDISEVIRHWQAGNSRRRIASGTGLQKDTVGRYISAAEALAMSREGPGPHRGAAQPAGRHQPLRPAAVGGAHRRQTGSVGRPGLPVADRRPAAGDPRSGIVGGAGLPSIVCLAAPVRRSPQLAGPEPQHGPDGGHRPRRGGGAGLRAPGPGPGPGDGPPPHGVGADRGPRSLSED